MARILTDDQIGKMSHNLDFEYQWSRRHFAIDHITWAWDSMLGAHVLHNRLASAVLSISLFAFWPPAYGTPIASLCNRPTCASRRCKIVYLILSTAMARTSCCIITASTALPRFGWLNGRCSNWGPR